MKTIKNLITVVAGLALIVGTARAQTGNAGIAASPKLREMMNSQAGLAAPPASLATHLCAMCKDDYVTRVDQTAKGAIKSTVTVATRLCPGCETTVSTVGQGKTGQNVVTHKCLTDGTESVDCCAAKKS